MDTAPRAEVRVTQRYGTPQDVVFGAWLDPEVTGKWLFATASRSMVRVAIDARIEGSYCLVDREQGEDIEYRGEYLEIIRPRRLVFTLSAPHLSHATTRVTVEITSLGRRFHAPRMEGTRTPRYHCELTLTHANVPPEHASRLEARWTGILYGLREILHDTRSGTGRTGGLGSRRTTAG